MASISARVQVKRSMRFKFLVTMLPVLLGLRLITPKRACKVFNHAIDKGALNIRINEGEWRPMDSVKLDME